MMHTRFSLHRRNLLCGGMALAAGGVLATGAMAEQPTAIKPAGQSPRLRFFAPSGYLTDPTRIETGLQRLRSAGFTLDNSQALYRRYQRFAGTDAERAADLQDVASGLAPTPKVLLGARGGYGAMRLLPLVNWAALGARMREAGTLMIGYSDICAVQLALLAQGQMGSFAGPLLYSEFGSPNPSPFTLQGFIDTVTTARQKVDVPVPATRHVDVEGVCWGGNLSVLASLAGSPYLPHVPGGILFIEDVGEQPYRLERMLQTLHLAGVFKQQQAIVLGTFRLSNERDLYDDSYDFNSVITTLKRLTRLPVLTNFPFGHIRDKVTMPLGFAARLHSTGNGYRVNFSGYPTLNAGHLNLRALLDIMSPQSAIPATVTQKSAETDD